MMHNINHHGLYFGPQAVQRAQKHRQRAPFADAFATLQAHQADNALEQAIASGTRYRFLNDDDAARQAVNLLTTDILGHAAADMSVLDQCTHLLATCQAIELVRDHLAGANAEWQNAFKQQVKATQELVVSDDDLLGLIWQATSVMGASIVTEDEARFEGTVEAFKRVIEQEIHPEGYLPRLVENSQEGALKRQVLAAQALSLMAEMAAQVGTDLWGYEVRGISVKTPAIYAAAYYEYRETWPWDEPPSEQENEAFYQQHAGFLEFLNRQLRPVVLKETLEKLRPLYSPVGGFTTLSHGIPARRGLFGF